VISRNGEHCLGLQHPREPGRFSSRNSTCAIQSGRILWSNQRWQADPAPPKFNIG